METGVGVDSSACVCICTCICEGIYVDKGIEVLLVVVLVAMGLLFRQDVCGSRSGSVASRWGAMGWTADSSVAMSGIAIEGN